MTHETNWTRLDMSVAKISCMRSLQLFGGIINLTSKNGDKRSKDENYNIKLELEVEKHPRLHNYGHEEHAL